MAPILVLTSPNTHSRRRAAAAILTSSALVVPGNVLPILAGLFADNYHINEQQIGYLISMNTFTALAVSVTAPLWIARVNARWLVPCCMVVLAIAYFCLALAPNYTGLLLLEIVIGAGAGAVASVCYTVMGQLADPARAWGFKVMSDVLLAWAFVKIVPNTHDMLLFTMSLAVVLSTLGMLGALLPARAIAHQPAHAAPNSLRDASVGAWLALVVMMVFAVGTAGVWAFVQRLELRAGISATASRDIFALGLLLGISGALAASLIGTRLGRVWPPTISGALLVLSVHLMSTTHSQLVFTFAFVGLNATWNFYLPYMMGLLAARDSTNRLSSLVNAALAMGSIVGPTLAGTLIHLSGYGLGMAVQSALIAAAVVLYVPIAMGAARTRKSSAPGTAPA